MNYLIEYNKIYKCIVAKIYDELCEIDILVSDLSINTNECRCRNVIFDLNSLNIELIDLYDIVLSLISSHNFNKDWRIAFILKNKSLRLETLRSFVSERGYWLHFCSSIGKGYQLLSISLHRSAFKKK